MGHYKRIYCTEPGKSTGPLRTHTKALFLFNMCAEVLSLLNGNISSFNKFHKVFVVRQHRDNLIRGDLAPGFCRMDVKIGVLERGTSIEKEIGKRGQIDLRDILALKSEADGEGEVLDKGKIL